MYRIVVFFITFFITFPKCNSLESNGFVSVDLNGQFGNQLFQIATAYAYALEHNLTLTIPDLVRRRSHNIPYNAKTVFLPRKISTESFSSKLSWTEPNFNFYPIPISNSLHLKGYFQSEKYFNHKRDEIRRLFSIPFEIEEMLMLKYPFLFVEPLIIGVQIRDYRKEFPNGESHPTIGRSYYERAFEYFPNSAIFIVSSNNLKYAKECTQDLSLNIIYLENNADVEDFYALSLCHSFIISNSSFGWWAAWLSENPNKVVITPKYWFALPYNNLQMKKDLIPPTWHQL